MSDDMSPAIDQQVSQMQLDHTQKYPLKRFKAIHGEDSEAAQSYGPGAFCWFFAKETGARWIEFLYPEHWHNSVKWIWDIIPVEPVANHHTHWHWDGDEELPNLIPSILIRLPWGDPPVETEIFHGFIRNGCLEVL